MRADDDQCEVFILDDHFRWFVNANQDLAPTWFLDALVWAEKLPPVPRKISSQVLARRAGKATAAAVAMRLFGSR
jgi:hypothetical protein